jgi:hypothetical protein
LRHLRQSYLIRLGKTAGLDLHSQERKADTDIGRKELLVEKNISACVEVQFMVRKAEEAPKPSIF